MVIICLGLAWQPPDWQESKATLSSHTAGHTINPVRDEPHPHREAINGPAEKEAQPPPSPLGGHSTGLHLWSAVTAPLYLLLARCGTNSAREQVILLWRGSLTSISPSRRLLWNNIKNQNSKIKSTGIILILKNLMKHDCLDGLLIWHEEQTFVEDRFGSNDNFQHGHEIQLHK